MKVTLLAGGTGGTKLAHGFTLLDPPVELTVIANVGDDVELHGLHVSPDVDALLYTLGGLIDADLATHVERTRRLGDGQSLTDATADMASALGIGARILPATEDRFRTILETDEGALDFQDYFVRRRQEPEVTAVTFDGAATARASQPVLEAIAGTDLVVIGPSNPIVSIGPILSLAGVREALEATSAPKVAVSPIVAGRALKGPADRMLVSLGHESTALGVARIYAGLVDRFILDTADAALAGDIEALGMSAVVLDTVMREDDDRRALAASLLAELPGGDRDRHDR